MSQFGDFHDFCRDSTLPVCNLFPHERHCALNGFRVGDGGVKNLGSIILCALAIIVSVLLLLLSQKKRAAVGRREMQIFLIFYILVSLVEIFTVGGFLTNRKVLVWFSGIHLGAIAATAWVLLLNAVVGFQLIDDGTLLSVGLVVGSALAFFFGTAYVALDTGFDKTGNFPMKNTDQLKNYALYVLYLLFPLVAIVAFFLLETFLVLKVLGEVMPMVRLGAAALLFAIGQIFNFVISVHLCRASSGKIDGTLFETLFTLLAVVAVWFFWSSITEDEWPDDHPMSQISEVYPS
ncbi:chitin synthase III catalytic subunit [Tuber borchii]|uniref:Chitin synthase III catalytic subunit n=1 Tax=Tuber borchii TaxID=42251 RepID=A0A2T6ZKE0_TUBBO|nr:chitin synthase III catalytic subunit [Tuber borchii]